jgi:hypothetical protein
MRWTSQRKSAVSDLIPADFARDLERQRDKLLERWSIWHPITDADADTRPVNDVPMIGSTTRLSPA